MILSPSSCRPHFTLSLLISFTTTTPPCILLLSCATSICIVPHLQWPPTHISTDMFDFTTTIMYNHHNDNFYPSCINATTLATYLGMPPLVLQTSSFSWQYGTQISNFYALTLFGVLFSFRTVLSDIILLINYYWPTTIQSDLLGLCRCCHSTLSWLLFLQFTSLCFDQIFSSPSYQLCPLHYYCSVSNLINSACWNLSYCTINFLLGPYLSALFCLFHLRIFYFLNKLPLD